MFRLAGYEIMWKKYATARQATRENIMRRRKDALCMPDNDDDDCNLARDLTVSMHLGLN
jgi:hypothetical protein